MKTSSRGIATAAIAVVIVVIIAVAGAAAYFALSGGSSTTGQSNSSTTNTLTSSASSSASSTIVTSSTTSATLPSSTTTQASSSTAVSSSSATSSTETTTISSFSCTTTYNTTTTGPAVDYTPQYIDLVSKFSQITFAVEGTTNGTQSENSTISYTATTVSSGIYDVNITFSSTGSTESGLARVDSNNESVISVTFSGYSFYGDQAKSFFDGEFALFGLEYTYGGYENILTNSAYFHSTGSSTMTFGSTSFSVTTWVANSLPLSINECGYSSDITDYTLQVGTPPGTTLNFITFLHYASDSPTTEDFTFKLVSMTQA